MGAPVTTPDKLMELALRIEEASEETEALFRKAYKAVYGSSPSERQYNAGLLGNEPNYDVYVHAKRFNNLIRRGAFLDAAMQLVPEGCAWTISSADPLTKAQAYACIADKEDNGAWVAEPWLHERTVWESYAATPALALTAACFRALSHQGGQNG